LHAAAANRLDDFSVRPAETALGHAACARDNRYSGNAHHPKSNEAWHAALTRTINWNKHFQQFIG
jgi:hypothetical protein